MIYHKTVLADLLTPVSAYLRVADGSDRAFLLESVEGGERVARYSFIGVDPQRSYRGSFAGFRASFPPPAPPHPSLPPFAGGAVGFFAYDLIREFERIPDRHSDTEGPAPVQMDFYTTVLAFDHVRHQIVIMSHEGQDRVEQMAERLNRAADQERIAQYSSLIQNSDRALPDTMAELERIRSGDSSGLEDPVGNVRAGFTRSQFCEAVEKAKHYIRAGDAFQIVLSQAFEVDYTGDPFAVYRALRFINPSPYMFFLKQGDLAIAGSSPEMLVRVQGRSLEYRPIAGTRRRGQDSETDERLEQELLKDEKERAEHLMLVDLGRNDLGRVSGFGDVQVEKLMFIERYSHVMHLVSALRGKLRDDLDRFDALAACFPAGTVTGAPKIRAMEIIEELEATKRGVYAGAIGYIDYSGNLDSCIAIRSVVLEGGKARFQAGAGIVADSIPEREDLECRNKARALLQAVQLAKHL